LAFWVWQILAALCIAKHGGIFYVESETSMLTDTKLRNLKPKEKL